MGGFYLEGARRGSGLSGYVHLIIIRYLYGLNQLFNQLAKLVSADLQSYNSSQRWFISGDGGPW